MYNRNCLYCDVRDILRQHYMWVFGISGGLLIGVTILTGLIAPAMISIGGQAIIFAFSFGMIASACIMLYDSKRDNDERKRRRRFYRPPPDRWNPIEIVKRKIQGLYLKDKEGDEKQGSANAGPRENEMQKP